MTKYISTTDTAKVIRKVLKSEFPETKFSVRSSKYSMGSSISISWEDGATDEQVETVTKRFAAKGCLGVDDYAPTLYDQYEGKLVRWGSDYINYYRSYSDGFKALTGEYMLETIKPLLVRDIEAVKNNVAEEFSKFLYEFRAKKAADTDFKTTTTNLIVETDSVFVYPCEAIAKENNIEVGEKVHCLKFTRFVYDPTLPTPDNCLQTSYIYKGKEYPEFILEEPSNIIPFPPKAIVKEEKEQQEYTKDDSGQLELFPEEGKQLQLF